MKVHAGEQAHIVHVGEHGCHIGVTLLIPLIATPVGLVVPLHVEDVRVQGPAALDEGGELVTRGGLQRTRRERGRKMRIKDTVFQGSKGDCAALNRDDAGHNDLRVVLVPPRPRHTQPRAPGYGNFPGD